MADPSANLTASIWSALGGDTARANGVQFNEPGALSSIFAVTDLASASIGAAALGVAELVNAAGGPWPAIRVDRRKASLWFRASIRPVGWSLPPAWDPIAGDYRSRDGWIRLHTNAPHHRAAAESVLGIHTHRDGVAAAVARWQKADLEAAIVAAGGCAAQMHSVVEWAGHPQGRAVAGEPLARIEATERGADRDWRIVPERPLAGVRVLDLTRVLAGPVASRFLAGYGAQVLRIDPPDWNEPGVVPEVTLGKRCARLDLRSANDRARFQALLSEADVLLHGYRANALDRLGFDSAQRARLNPGLIDVALNAYGWIGPWLDRRGFDSLVQMSTGIADAGTRWQHADHPVPLPVQALDHATGYLMAAATLRAMTRKLSTGRGSAARLALARTAKLLIDCGDQPSSAAHAHETAADLAPTLERTPWGDARRLSAPVTIEGIPMHWDLPAAELGSSAPHWW